jgi:predicted chitinase
MMLDELREICPSNAGKAEVFCAALVAAMQEFDISSRTRQAAFVAQIAHETGEFRYMREIDSGVAYEGRHDLGNTQPGDGALFKGGGGFMITGRDAYLRCGQALGVDLVGHPCLIEVPAYAMRSAGWFWQTHRLNALADIDHFGSVTRTINGGYNGLDSRIVYWARARDVLLH